MKPAPLGLGRAPAFRVAARRQIRLLWRGLASRFHVELQLHANVDDASRGTPYRFHVKSLALGQVSSSALRTDSHVVAARQIPGRPQMPRPITTQQEGRPSRGASTTPPLHVERRCSPATARLPTHGAPHTEPVPARLQTLTGRFRALSTYVSRATGRTSRARRWPDRRALYGAQPAREALLRGPRSCRCLPRTGAHALRGVSQGDGLMQRFDSRETYPLQATL